MADLGLSACRFSVSWSRVMPDGRAVSQAGLDSYRRLVDQLRDNGIEPLPTLYHRDLPRALADIGGWRSRALVDHFTTYARTMHRALGDRVHRWTTINEPFYPAFLDGRSAHASGRLDPAGALVAAHHLLLAHGTALMALRAMARSGQEFSLALNFSPALADGHDPEHVEAARKFDGLHNRFFLDPVLGNGYPTDVLADVADIGGGLAEAISDGDLETIAAPIDRLGVSYQPPTRVTPLPEARASSNSWLPGLHGMDIAPARGPATSFGSGQDQGALTGLLRWLNWHTGGLPLMIVESGATFEDGIDVWGPAWGAERASYTAAHLRAVHAAIAEGADVRGYFLSSLPDDVERSTFYRETIALNAIPTDA